MSTAPPPHFLASEDTLFDQFDPIMVDEQSGSYQRELDEVKALDEHHVWTVVEAGDSSNSLWAMPGLHHVNRVYYIRTAKPWVEGQQDLLWLDGLDFAMENLRAYEEGDAEWEEACYAIHERVTEIREHIATQLCSGTDDQVQAWLSANPSDPITARLSELQAVLPEGYTPEEAGAFAP
ncbi:hypothetical protein [Pseudoxanthomonas kaohsiungensis]|uniref:DUF4375 domain-containing protein n=1 Tax=Pseudoxanthomonas kaohsiungensis TaxID=283923 RepID=A0ABW3LXI7_9GAMM|nr:hypothetical protein [Pseudoxanthomonas kaohsiungensis]KAF1702913.1 hypothetical protein CSC66_09060 [Pseudoxanthomonas kaohsiungensis]